MEFYLVENGQLVFKPNLPMGAYHDHINFPNDVLANFEGCQILGTDKLVGKSPSTNEDAWISENRFCSRAFPIFFGTLDKRPKIMWQKCTVAMTITHDESIHDHHPHCQEMENGWLHIEVFSSGKSSILDVARMMKNVKIGVLLESLQPDVLGSREFLHARKFEDLKIERWYNENDGDYRIGCTLPPIQVPGFAMTMLSRANQGPQFKGSISVFLIFNNAAINSVFTNNGFGNSENLLKEMLEKEVCSDFELISRDEERLKCHRSILHVVSPVFNAMLESRELQIRLQENAQNSAKVLDGTMSKVEIQAFLKYLYYGDMVSPLEDCGIALTLLKAGDYYQIPDLVKDMQDVLLIKSGLMRVNGEWMVDVDTAVDLLIFTRRKSDEIKENIEEELGDIYNFNPPFVFQEVIYPWPGPVSKDGDAGGDENDKKRKETCTNNMRDMEIRQGWKNLKAKAVYILQWWAKNKPVEFKTSEKFKQIWRKSEDFAEEMGTEFLQLS